MTGFPYTRNPIVRRRALKRLAVQWMCSGAAVVAGCMYAVLHGRPGLFVALYLGWIVYGQWTWMSMRRAWGPNRWEIARAQRRIAAMRAMVDGDGHG